MTLKHYFSLTILVVSISCANEENLTPVGKKWVLTRYKATVSSKCFAFPDSGEDDYSNPIFATLLDLKNDGAGVPRLWFINSKEFTIDKQEKVTMRGSFVSNDNTLTLNYLKYSLSMKIQRSTDDSLVVHTQGYDEIKNVTVFFYLVKNRKIE